MAVDANYNRLLENAYKQIYAKNTDLWTSQFEMRVMPKMLLSELPEKPKNILDVGCGRGEDTRYFAQQNIACLGIDIVSHSAWQKIMQENKLTSFRRESILKMGSEDKFDLIYDNGCFHHFQPSDYALYVKQVKRLIQGNGILAINTFYLGETIVKYDEFNRIIKFFELDELVNIFSVHGFKLMSSTKIKRLNVSSFYHLTIFKLQRMGCH